MKLIIKCILIPLSVIIIFIALYFLVFYCLSRITVNRDRIPANDYTIYLKSNGVHADIVVPVQTSIIDWSKIVKYENTNGKDSTAGWLGIGWGDKGFYLQTPTWADLKFSVAFRAATGLSTAAIHATYYNHISENEKCVKIRISESEYMKLIEFILNDFKKTDSGETILIVTDANYGLTDAFYEAKGKYHMFHTCNTWTNNAFKSAGLKTGLWTPFESGLLIHYKPEPHSP